MCLQALEICPTDTNALIARSNCFLQLGEPIKALEDAETAINADKSNIRAIYQKAESLYYLGQFEHSLMFFHRGHKIRPELKNFQLGIQKTQEVRLLFTLFYFKLYKIHIYRQLRIPSEHRSNPQRLVLKPQKLNATQKQIQNASPHENSSANYLSIRNI